MEQDREMLQIQSRDRIRQIIVGKSEKLIDAILANHWHEPMRLAKVLADIGGTAVELTIEYRPYWHIPSSR